MATVNTAVRYEWRTHPHFVWEGNAQIIAERLEGIERDKGGITPKDVVEDARSSESPLHPNFEWNDEKAAAQYREYTARNLLGSIVVVKVNDVEISDPPRAFVNVRVDDRRYYKTTVQAFQDGELHDQVLRSAINEIAAWRKRYAQYQEFGKLVASIDEVLPQLAVTA